MAATASNVLLFSVAGGAGVATLPGVGSIGGNDILSYDGSSFGWFFRGSDVGVTADIDAFALLSDTEILLSFDGAATLPGLGAVDGSDIVLFSAGSLGANTAGAFSLYFDGSQFGLGTSANANVDALELLDNGHLLISTAGDLSLPTPGGPLSVADEDLLEFIPGGPGPITSGSWSLYFDGSDVGLTLSTEDVDAAALGPNGNLLLSTIGSFFVPGLGGDDEDVFEFIPASLGSTTSGTALAPLFLDGSAVNSALVSLNLDAVELWNPPAPAPPVNQDPLASSQSVTTNEDQSLAIQLAGDDGDPNTDQPLTFTLVSGPQHGTLAGFDPSTGQATYIPNPDFHGTDSFTFTVTDNPGGGAPGLTSSPASVTIDVAAVNDAPTLSLPQGEQRGDANETVVIHGISVSDGDVDAGDGLLELRLSVRSGRLTVAADDPGIQSISGNGTDSIVLLGTEAGLNAALAQGVQYAGAPDFAGNDLLSIAVNDRGNFGWGGALSAGGVVVIEITAPVESDPLEALRAQVEGLIASGALPARFGTPLLKKLDLRGDRADALKLGAFILETHALHKCGYLTRAQAQSLISQADEILDGVKSHGGWSHVWWRSHRWCVPRLPFWPVDHVFMHCNRMFDAISGMGNGWGRPSLGGRRC